MSLTVDVVPANSSLKSLHYGLMKMFLLHISFLSHLTIHRIQINQRQYNVIIIMSLNQSKVVAMILIIKRVTTSEIGLHHWEVEGH